MKAGTASDTASRHGAIERVAAAESIILNQEATAVLVGPHIFEQFEPALGKIFRQFLGIEPETPRFTGPRGLGSWNPWAATATRRACPAVSFMRADSW